MVRYLVQSGGEHGSQEHGLHALDGQAVAHDGAHHGRQVQHAPVSSALEVVAAGEVISVT